MVRHDAGNQRFVAEIGGEATEAVLKYRYADDRTIEYYSTFTPTALRGRGIAGQIVSHALDFAAQKGLRVVPTCPYVARFVDRNPQYRELVH